MKTRIVRSEIQVTNMGGLEVCRGGESGRCVGEVSGRCRGGVLGKAGKGMMLEGWRAGGRELAPLYYPDTLVNQDTCLGRIYECFCT